MLTDSEKKEINYNKLSDLLKRKIDAAFESPYYNTALALFTQRYTLEQEMIEHPFKIREISGEGENARQNTETAIKVAKWLTETADDLEVLQNKLSPEENRQIVKKVTTATDLKKEAFGE